MESQGRVNIYVDTLDRNGKRQIGVQLRFGWPDNFATTYTSAKPGELYAADFPMCNLAPIYSAQPDDGAPADRVDGMGLGEIDSPDYAHHTSYGLIWRWTIAPR